MSLARSRASPHRRHPDPDRQPPHHGRPPPPDATSISGTIFAGERRRNLAVEVSVEPHAEQPRASPGTRPRPARRDRTARRAGSAPPRSGVEDRGPPSRPRADDPGKDGEQEYGSHADRELRPGRMHAQRSIRKSDHQLGHGFSTILLLRPAGTRSSQGPRGSTLWPRLPSPQNRAHRAITAACSATLNRAARSREPFGAAR